MAAHDTPSRTDEWYTPRWVFESLGARFDLDPCSSPFSPAVEFCEYSIFAHEGCGLEASWSGSVWLNPPFGGRNAVVPWLEKFVAHGEGIALLPNRTGAGWWQDVAEHADLLLFHRGKIKFEQFAGASSESPGFGNVFMAMGDSEAILRASKLVGVRLS